jgi:hypothetical protein
MQTADQIDGPELIRLTAEHTIEVLERCDLGKVDLEDIVIVARIGPRPDDGPQPMLVGSMGLHEGERIIVLADGINALCGDGQFDVEPPVRLPSE